MSHLLIQLNNETTPEADSRLDLYWQANLKSIEYQKTNNVGSGLLRYTIWHFPLQCGRICLTHTVNSNIRHCNDG